jgi:hypothetical protein
VLLLGTISPTLRGDVIVPVSHARFGVTVQRAEFAYAIVVSAGHCTAGVLGYKSNGVHGDVWALLVCPGLEKMGTHAISEKMGKNGDAPIIRGKKWGRTHYSRENGCVPIIRIIPLFDDRLFKR